MQTNRALAAATAIARDFPHMMSGPICVVPLDKWRAQDLITPGRHMVSFASEAPMRTFRLSEVPFGIMRQMRDTKNKRMLAAISLAVETDAKVTVELVHTRNRPVTGRMTVHADMLETRDRSSLAVVAAATYLRITHSEMVRIATEKASRTGDAPSFAITYPEYALECICATSNALYAITSWAARQITDDQEARALAKAARIKAASPLSSSMSSIVRLHELMEAITPEGLAHADMPLFEEARRIVERLAA